MNCPVQIIEKIKLIYPPSPESAFPPNNLIDNKLKKLNDVVNNHESQLVNFFTFSQIYAKKCSTLKFEYEQKILILEKFIADHNQRHKAYIKKIETENQNRAHHTVNA